jgi:hypothetical protein
MFVIPTRPRKPVEMAEARRLRGTGASLKGIAAQLGVSPSSVKAWTADIVLTSEQIAANLDRSAGEWHPERLRHAAAARSATCRARRLESQAQGRARARGGDPLHQAGCMLYWAEGSKDRNDVRLTNSDSRLVQFFCRFLTVSLEIDPLDIRVSINVYTNNGLSIRDVEEHWLGVLGLPRSCLRKHRLNHTPTSSSGQARGRLPYGVCRVSVHSTRAVQQIYGAIQEYGGFDEPSWLG